MHERTQVKNYREQIYYLTPHLTFRLCTVHNNMGLGSLFQGHLDQLFNCMNFLCKVFTKYLKLCERIKEYPFPKNTPAAPAIPPGEYSWNWLEKDDPDIIVINMANANLDSYIRETVILGARLLADKVLTNPSYTPRYFDILINILEKDCIDETILEEIVKCAHSILKNSSSLAVGSDPAHSGASSSMHDKSKILGKMLEKNAP